MRKELYKSSTFQPGVAYQKPVPEGIDSQHTAPDGPASYDSPTPSEKSMRSLPRTMTERHNP